MTRFVLLFILFTGPCLAQVSGQSPPVAAKTIIPSANVDGSVTTTTTNTDGTVVTSTTQPINSVTVTGYVPNAAAPTALTVSAATPLQLPDGYGVFNLAGSGIIVAAAVKLPPTPKDGQLARLVVPSGLTITTLTVQSGSGVAVATLASVVFGMTPLFQWQNTSWTKIGS